MTEYSRKGSVQAIKKSGPSGPDSQSKAKPFKNSA